MKEILSVMARCALLIGLCAAGPSRAQPGAMAAGPAFVCSAPSEIKAIICHDAALSAADRLMATLYQTAKAGAMNNGSNQIAAQRRWLMDRDTQCSSGAWNKFGYRSAHDCVSGAYKERLKSLAVTNLLATPQLALAELRADAPKEEPYYEALLDYAAIDDPTRRSKVVEAKLAILYPALSPQVRDGLNRVGKNVETPRETASSDAGFAQFFDIASMEDDLQLTWPCAALIRRPGLVAGLGSIWGGTIDSQVPSSDCSEALPSPQELTTLAQLAFDAQPPCEGTIRFSTGRDYAMLEDAVRLRRRDIWQGRDGQSSKEEAVFRRKWSAVIERTSAALAAYYSQ